MSKKFNILNKIVSQKRKELRIKKEALPLAVIKKNLKDKEAKTCDFKKALLKSKGVAIIAEIKKASPSTGIINKRFNLEKIIKIYAKAKVDAISVLTDEKFFQGSLENLSFARETTKIPLLRKDFIVDAYQIYESKLYRADAILLIAAILSDKKIKKFTDISHNLGMDCLVEIHNLSELKRVLKLDIKIIGINNRNLKNFKIDIKNSLKIAPKIPTSKIIVSESGIKSKEDVKKLKKVGVKAILVGTTFMKSKNIKETIKQLKL